MKALFFLLLTISLVAAQTQPIRTFQASFSAVESQGGFDRVFKGKLFYSDTWVTATSTGTEAIRYDIDLNDGQISTTLTQLEIYQDQFFKYTICFTCSWQDLFAESPLPQLYVDGESPAETNVNINNVITDRYVIDQENVLGDDYDNFVTLYVSQQTPRWVVRAIINLPGGVTKRIDMAAHSTSIPANAFAVPAGCPDIDPGCFRLDLAFVVDISGSVGEGGAEQERQFVLEMIDTFLIGPKYLAASLTTFSSCANAQIRTNMNYNKADLLSDIPGDFDSDGYTCIVGGIQRGFWTFATPNGSRPATSKGMIVLTDGNGNRPCSPINVLENPNESCQSIDIDTWSCIPDYCNGYHCSEGGCCQSSHDCHLEAFYASEFAKYNPRVFAVGVTDGISDSTLRAIVNDPGALGRGEVRIVRVGNFADLNRIITALAAAILCDVPGSEACPNDCRPGGFCCGGSCQCTIDCTTLSTECQLGVCKADINGADCQLSPPDDAACVNPAFQCQDRYCEIKEGCKGTPNDNLGCTDNNLCTIDVCINGTCTTNKNDSVSQCDDHNPCTAEDACLPDGSCLGTPDDSLLCDDDDLCTNNVCFNGTCLSDVIGCTDDTITDCRIPKCNPATGDCDDTFVEPDYQCLPPDPNDKCTVFVCSEYDPQKAANCDPSTQTCDYGACVARTRNDDECKGSDDNTAAIIGGVIGGVALLCILLIAAIILLLILCRKAVVGVVGNLNPFGASTDVKTAPTYVSPMDTGASELYEGS